MAIIVVAGGLGIFYWQVREARADVVETWGMADAKEININSKVSGRVVSLLVDEGDAVKAGQVIAHIDSDYQEPQQRQAQSTLAAQYAQLQQVIFAAQSAQGTLDADLNAAQAKLTQATTAVELATKEETRYKNLLAVGAVSIETYDTYKAQLDDALAVQATAQASVDSAQAALLQNEQNQAQIDAARQQATALQSQLDSANLNLHETEIRAPFDGIITNKYVEPTLLLAKKFKCKGAMIQSRFLAQSRVYAVKLTSPHKKQLRNASTWT